MSQAKGKSTKELITLVKKLIPPLSPNFHKGQAGRIAVFGGCEDYTGAPFLAAHAAAVFGADLSHIICEKNAAQVIKTYSPDLMVHPYLYETDTVPSNYSDNQESFLKTKVLPKVESLLSRIHVAIVGPGLGRDQLMLDTLEIVLGYLIEKRIPVIIDADGLFLVSKKPEIIKGYSSAILTPNVVEFKRLADALNISTDSNNQLQEAIEVSKKLGNITIIRKGTTDLIVKGDSYLEGNFNGSNRRVGGQGDSLTGTVATLVAWSKAYQDGLWKHPENELLPDDLFLLAGYGGSSVTRVAASLAFEEKGRAMQASDLHSKIGEAYKILFEQSNTSLERFQGIL